MSVILILDDTSEYKLINLYNNSISKHVISGSIWKALDNIKNYNDKIYVYNAFNLGNIDLGKLFTIDNDRWLELLSKLGRIWVLKYAELKQLKVKQCKSDDEQRSCSADLELYSKSNTSISGGLSQNIVTFHHLLDQCAIRSLTRAIELYNDRLSTLLEFLVNHDETMERLGMHDTLRKFWERLMVFQFNMLKDHGDWNFLLTYAMMPKFHSVSIKYNIYFTSIDLLGSRVSLRNGYMSIMDPITSACIRTKNGRTFSIVQESKLPWVIVNHKTYEIIKMDSLMIVDGLRCEMNEGKYRVIGCNQWIDENLNVSDGFNYIIRNHPICNMYNKNIFTLPGNVLYLVLSLLWYGRYYLQRDFDESLLKEFVLPTLCGGGCVRNEVGSAITSFEQTDEHAVIMGLMLNKADSYIVPLNNTWVGGTGSIVLKR